MKNEKPIDSGVIAVFVEGLQDIPGWITMSRKKQDAMLQITSDVQQFHGMRQLGEFGELLRLTEAEQLLEGEEMKMADYMRLLYPDKHKKTIERKLQVFGQIVANIPHSKLKSLSALGADVLSRFERIAHAALGDIRNAVRELASLPSSTEQNPEKYLEALDTQLSQQRKKKSKALTRHRDVNDAAKFIANALIHYARSSDAETSAERRHLLTRAVGWAMEALAIGGTIHITRVPIPDGVLIRRGRPRKHPKKEAA
jgi:hypothetical protein